MTKLADYTVVCDLQPIGCTHMIRSSRSTGIIRQVTTCVIGIFRSRECLHVRSFMPPARSCNYHARSKHNCLCQVPCIHLVCRQDQTSLGIAFVVLLSVVQLGRSAANIAPLRPRRRIPTTSSLWRPPTDSCMPGKRTTRDGNGSAQRSACGTRRIPRNSSNSLPESRPRFRNCAWTQEIAGATTFLSCWSPPLERACRRRSSEIIVVNTGKNDWVVDKLP